ncbi:MAG: hypothetical protein OEW11_03025 [Nitrospirota bacterium]|nr:hypothetical protein [Nitrospirota bacterium]
MKPLTRSALAAVATALPWCAPGTALALVERNGYRYVQVSLSGLWGSFFFFLFGIFFVLVGLLLFFLWRRSLREAVHEPLGAAQDEDGQVF